MSTIITALEIRKPLAKAQTEDLEYAEFVY
jgi:hypothetical protein